MSEIIKLKKVNFSYGIKEVLKNINLSFKTQGIHSIIGLNGAGKTTLLNLLAQKLSPSIGEIKFTLKDAFKIGYLPEDPPLYYDFTPKEYFYYMLKLLNQTRDKKRLKNKVEEIINDFKISVFEDKLIGTLSKGQKQKVALAISLLNNPEILILDEPLSGLDYKNNLELKKILKRLSQNICVILSEHQFNLINELSDFITLIHQGEILFSGSKQEFIDQYNIENSYSISFEEFDKKALEKFNSSCSFASIKNLSNNNNLKNLTLTFKDKNKKVSDLTQFLVNQNFQLESIYKKDLSIEEIFINYLGNIHE